MERRTAKVNISAAGGTAAKGAKTYKITLPTAWMAALDVKDGNRELDISFDGERVVISRCMFVEEFYALALRQGHDVRIFRYMDGDRLCSEIAADFTNRTLAVRNSKSDPVKTAFGNNLLPTWEDFQAFLEDRCIPRGRAGLREYLEAIGVSGYDPLEIIGKTDGRMAEDDQWLHVVAPIPEPTPR